MLEKAIKLYEMMAARHAKTGWSQAQAAVYTEIAEFMRTKCATIEEATEKLSKPPLSIAPTVALMKDKINAYIRAAEDDKVRGVAEMLREKLAELDRDPNSVYDSAYFLTAQNLYTKYYAPIEAFKDIYKRYIELESNSTYTSYMSNKTSKFDKGFLPFQMAFEQFEHYESDLAECSRRPEFREVIHVSDAAYERFVRDAVRYRANPSEADPIPYYQDAEKRVAAVWENFTKEPIEEALKLRGEKSKDGACMMVAPPDGHGDYEYTEIVTLDKK